MQVDPAQSRCDRVSDTYLRVHDAPPDHSRALPYQSVATQFEGDRQSSPPNPPRLVANVVRLVHDDPVHRVKRPRASTTVHADDEAQSTDRSVFQPAPMLRSDQDVPFHPALRRPWRCHRSPTRVQEVVVGQDRSMVTKSGAPVAVEASLGADHVVPYPVRYLPSTTAMHHVEVAQESWPW